MRAFEYHRPGSLIEACQLLAERAGDVRVLAGGQSLLNMMKLRIMSPAALVDIRDIAGIRDISLSKTGLKLGSMVTYRSLGAGLKLHREFAIISEAVAVIADMHVRNLGTVGGAACQADPFADMPNALVTLGAQFELKGPERTRRIGAVDFFKGPFETAVEPDELLVCLDIPRPHVRSGSAYEKFSWRMGDYAIAAVAALITLDVDGKCISCRLVAGSLGGGPVRLTAGEEAMHDRVVSLELIKAAAADAASSCEPEPDAIYGSSEYKRRLLRTLATRAMERAWRRAQEGRAPSKGVQ